MIDQKTVLNEIKCLDLVFGIQRGEGDLHTLAATWWQDLSPYMSTESFLVGLQITRQTCSHYPRPADIIRAHREHSARSCGQSSQAAAALPRHGGVTPPSRIRLYIANILAIMNNRPLPHPECVPDPKWRTWQPSDHGTVHDTSFAAPGQPLSRYESPDYQPKQAEPGSMHDPRRGRIGNPDEDDGQGFVDWDEYRKQAANE